MGIGWNDPDDGNEYAKRLRGVGLDDEVRLSYFKDNGEHEFWKVQAKEMSNEGIQLFVLDNHGGAIYGNPGNSMVVVVESAGDDGDDVTSDVIHQSVLLGDPP